MCDSISLGGPCVPYAGSACIVCTGQPQTNCGMGVTVYLNADNCNAVGQHVNEACPIDYIPYTEYSLGGSCDTDSCVP
jgi:hypothetical protein